MSSVGLWDKNAPFVFTDVAEHKEWIDSVLNGGEVKESAPETEKEQESSLPTE